MSLFVAILLSLIIEIILDVTWYPFYFRRGILLYKKRFKVGGPQFSFPTTDMLNDSFDEGRIMPSLVFRAIGENEIGVRERMLKFTYAHYTAILHGNIQYNQSRNEVTLRCFSNLTITVILICVGVVIWPDLINEFRNIGTYGNPVINAMSILFICFCILFIPVSISLYQISRFRKVISFLLEEKIQKNT